MPREASTSLPQPIFDESTITPDPTRFSRTHSSDSALYNQLGNLLKTDVVGFDPMRGSPDSLYELETALGPHGPEIIDGITKANQITFHAAGDSGASNQGKYRNEINVADQVTHDCHSSPASDRPAFFYHLGDVVYDFGESQYWYDQFYDPFRNYPAPVFAIPGNHDSFVVPNTPSGEEPLKIFVRNFCAEEPTITQEAGSLHRTAMTQPGVYFTLDAPFVRIIGLFSNALEDPGVISNKSKRWPAVPNVQLDYLTAQLQRIKKEKYKGAVLLTMHHPPFTYSPPPKGHGSRGNHSSSSDMLREIDTICSNEGVYPHAVLSGHAHNYQRYTRTIEFNGKEYDVPFIVCGDGGHNVNTLVRASKGHQASEPANGTHVDYLESKPAVKSNSLLLEKYDDHNYGYLRITVTKEQLRIGFHQVGLASLNQSRFDLVTVDLASHTMVSN